MSYSPNVPSLTVSDELTVSDMAVVLLAEFSGSSPVREVLMDPTSETSPDEALESIEGDESIPLTQEQLLARETFMTKPVATASGLRLHRVMNAAKEIVTQFDATLDRTPLDFLGKTGAVVVVAQPGDTYTWNLIKLGAPSEDGTVAPIIAMRPAKEVERATLNEMYPGWLEACKQFDIDNMEKEAKDRHFPVPVLPTAN